MSRIGKLPLDIPEKVTVSVEANAVCQDNKSTILLEKNGKKSAGKKNRSI